MYHRFFLPQTVVGLLLPVLLVMQRLVRPPVLIMSAFWLQTQKDQVCKRPIKGYLHIIKSE